MSELALFKGGLPAYLKNAADDATNALAGTGEGGLGVLVVFQLKVEYSVSLSVVKSIVFRKSAP